MKINDTRYQMSLERGIKILIAHREQILYLSPL